MRRHTGSQARATAASIGLPTAIAGSIAVVLSGPAAAAAPVDVVSDVRSESRGTTLRLAAGDRVPDTYTVKAGDTVSAIAARFGLRTTDVLALNRLSWSSVIYPGQKLRLVESTGSGTTKKPQKKTAKTYVVKPGDTVSGIAQKHGRSVTAVLKANRLGWSSIIYPGQKIVIPGTSSAASGSESAKPKPKQTKRTHVVASGDTVSAIARANGVSVQAVLDANGLGWSSIIYPGQRIRIPGAGAPASSSTIVRLDKEQRGNARLIIRIGRELGVPERGIAIALGAAMQESSLRNLDWGDRDSLGLFQQRPSAGWGTARQVRDRERAIRAFFGGAHDPNGSRTRGLLDIPGWQKMTFTQAAQAVQISAYPDRYARWQDDARAWLKALG